MVIPSLCKDGPNVGFHIPDMEHIWDLFPTFPAVIASSSSFNAVFLSHRLSVFFPWSFMIICNTPQNETLVILIGSYWIYLCKGPSQRRYFIWSGDAVVFLHFTLRSMLLLVVKIRPKPKHSWVRPSYVTHVSHIAHKKLGHIALKWLVKPI